MDKIRFAVVGHPNKGKSSIVSTLSRNDAIEVSPRSGTTTITGEYQVKIMDKSYWLFDTPGFQRPRQLLNWLRDHADNASERSAAVKQFVSDPETRRAFPDEVALLTPIVEGAAIIYVVDGSHPYGPEYEAEMEILRWCGQPRMALINPIQDESHIGEWHKALDQYFSVVQTFNPMTATVDQQAHLLKTFSIIAPDWSGALTSLADALKEERISWRHQAAALLACWLDEACQTEVSQKVLEESQADKLKPVLLERFQSNLKRQEKQTLDELRSIYRHLHTAVSLEELELPPDLFDLEQWYLWGLNRTQLLTSMTVSGMVAGGTIDMLVGGASALAGTIIGGISGFASGWLGADELQKMRVRGLPMGGYEARIGPIKDPNFPYVLINRFVHLHRQLVDKNHADRHQLNADIPSWTLTLERLGDKIRKQLQDCCGRLIKQDFVSLEELSETLYQILLISELPQDH